MHEQHAREQAVRVAAFGYVVFACDMFGDGVRGDRQRTMATIGALVADPDRLCARAVAGLDVLTAHPRVDGRTAAVGYCFGGTTVLEMARAGAAGPAPSHRSPPGCWPATAAPTRTCRPPRSPRSSTR